MAVYQVCITSLLWLFGLPNLISDRSAETLQDRLTTDLIEDPLSLLVVQERSAVPSVERWIIANGGFVRREGEKVATVGSVCGREPGLDKGSIEGGFGMNRRSWGIVVRNMFRSGLE